MIPRIETFEEKKLLGKSVKMSLSDNKTAAVWSSFMTEKKVISNAVGTDLYSIQIYEGLADLNSFNSDKEFTKWAAIEVPNFNIIPIGFKTLILPSGLYAVFLHKGKSSEFLKTFQFIFKTWLPKSQYELDNRPHFEILGARYTNDHPNSEEEICIPIKKK